MTESSELHEKVDKILQRVESMDSFMPWLIRPQAEQIRESLLAWFKKQSSAARVYLEIDGDRTVTAIGQKLGMKQPNVSREIAKLRDDVGLIEQKTVGNTTVYRKTKIDRVLGLTKELERQYSDEVKPQEKSDDKEQAANGDNGII
jgi:hypothetical protein